MKTEFVIVAKDENFSLTREETTQFEKEHQDVTFNYVSNNKLSLADVYNSFIQKHRATKDIDCLVLMHADVRFNIESLLKHIEEVNGKYDVLGLCGCSKMTVSASPLNWWTASNPFPKYKWGCVSHGELGNQLSFFSSHHPMTYDHEVACIDGLCIILLKKAIEDSDILFDRTFEFSHYDTDFSFQCVMQKNLKLGVIVQKDLQHQSVGKSILTPEFMISEEKFRTKWNMPLPNKAEEAKEQAKEPVKEQEQAELSNTNTLSTNQA